jgi:hypothetical protein
MLPHERSLVKRLQDEPFALIGINSDGEAAGVRKRLAAADITWRNAIDETLRGPLATEWNVNGWPTIYIIDAEGVIRYRDLRDEEMEAAIVQLLAEAQAR